MKGHHSFLPKTFVLVFNIIKVDKQNRNTVTVQFLGIQLLFSFLKCPSVRFVTILLKARHEELIVWRKDECSLLLRAICEVLQAGKKKKKEDVHPSLGGESNLGPPEW